MNTKEQGAIGIAKAISYFGSQGHLVFVPVSDIKRYDLIVDYNGTLQRVEVKTTKAESGEVQLRTLGGNQSWNGLVKKLSSKDSDMIYLVNLNTGAEIFYKTSDLEGRSSIRIK